jgi:hypothetical protein
MAAGRSSTVASRCGEEVPGEWSAAQLDGYGSWVWALGQHVRRHGADPAPWLAAARLSLHYGRACWQALLRLVGGAATGSRGDARRALWWADPGCRGGWAADAAEAIRTAVHVTASWTAGSSARLGEGGLDASLIAARPRSAARARRSAHGGDGAALESELGRGSACTGTATTSSTAAGCGSSSPRSSAGTTRVADEWRSRGAAGVDRRRGERAGRPSRAGRRAPAASEKRREWVERWGPPAFPLLWSHALFLTLALELGALRMETRHECDEGVRNRRRRPRRPGRLCNPQTSGAHSRRNSRVRNGP